MSDDDDDHADSETNLFDESLDGHESMGFGPLVPTESERSLMERVRQELKSELKQVRKHHLIITGIKLIYSVFSFQGLQGEARGHKR